MQYTSKEYSNGGSEAFEMEVKKAVKNHETKFGKAPVRLEKLTDTAQEAKDANQALTDVVMNLKNIVKSYEAVKMGDRFRGKAPREISFGQYCSERFGIATDANGSLAGMWNFLGLPDRSAMTLASLQEATPSGMNFATVPEYNEGFRWLIGEVILDPIRVVMLQRGIWRQLISGSTTTPFDTIVAPIVSRSARRWQQLREGAQIKSGNITFSETRIQLKTIATGITLTDEVVRNMQLSVLQEYIANMVGMDLDDRMTYDCIQTILNGNDPAGSDAASIVGVTTTGTLDYDDDWLPLVIKMITLGMRPDVVLGDALMITDVMRLPEFKGFNGDTKVAQLMLDRGIRALMPSEYAIIPTGAMPVKGSGGGKLLFMDPLQTVAHYTSKPLTMESQRLVDKLSDFHAISMTTGFMKKRVDSSFVLDTSVNVSANPFPAALDSERLQRAGYEK